MVWATGLEKIVLLPQLAFQLTHTTPSEFQGGERPGGRLPFVVKVVVAVVYAHQASDVFFRIIEGREVFALGLLARQQATVAFKPSEERTVALERGSQQPVRSEIPD